MRKLLLMFVSVMALLLVVSFGLLSFAADDYESLTINGTAAGFTASKITTTPYLVRRAYCTLENGNIRYRVDGSSPTASEGHYLPISSTLDINGRDDIVNFSAISQTSVSGTLKCSYWK